jgi:hypothetical protein
MNIVWDGSHEQHEEKQTIGLVTELCSLSFFEQYGERRFPIDVLIIKLQITWHAFETLMQDLNRTPHNSKGIVS